MAGRKARRAVCAALLAALCALAGCGGQTRPRGPGLFSWSAVEEGPQLDRMAAVVRQLGIGQVYQAFSSEELAAGAPRALVGRLRQAGAETYLCVGRPEWGLEEDGAALCASIEEAAAYNRAAGKKERLSGVLVDAEPYLTDAWDEDKADVMRRWCGALVSARACAEKNGLSLIACLPRWLDAVDKDILEQMIAKGCDAVALMNYGRSDEAAAMEEEWALARRYGREVVCIMELAAPGRHDLTEEQTYWGEGLDALHASWEALQGRFGGEGLRFAYHYYKPLCQLLEQEGALP